MKKYIAVFLSVIMCICLFGCGKANTLDAPVNAGGEISKIEENTAPYSESSKESVTEDVSESGREESSKAKPTSSNTSETKTAPSQSETASTPTVAPSEKPTEPPSKIACTVQVECKSILGKKNKFKKDISLVRDGVLLYPVKVYLDDDATAYDALKKACAENGVALNEKNSAFGVYIAGIGGIDEKDCGPQSGWVYTVNGQSPSVGLSNYKIKNGDSLVLSYVC
ncbi:MAG: DUF4430 domain-containing protein [Oscillospiraceae bacterium]|nr:DUF4430 domain-containing protein [Oscillospiraceae bacterium]